MFRSEEVYVSGVQYVVKERIAEGGFGFVDLVVNPITQQQFVLKRCSVVRPEIQEIVQKEINILRKFEGPNIVKLISSDMNTSGGKKEAQLLLEYCSGGHLLSKLNSRNGVTLTNSNILDIFTQIISALTPFHSSSPPIIHRDLKLENILFCGEIVRLCDFGSCVVGYVPLKTADDRSRAEEKIQKETTQMYRAPEMVDLYMRDELTEKTDIWALGCILYALCFLTHPFQEAGNLGILSGKITMPSNFHVSNEFRNLITICLDMDPEARPDLAEISTYLIHVSEGREPPEHVLSEVAQQKRAERIAAQQRREMHVSKKAAPVVPVREQPVPLAANSVAAKRLAAKKAGQTLTSDSNLGTVLNPGPNIKPAAKGASVDLFFEDEPSSPAPATSSNHTTTSSNSSFDLFSAPATNTASTFDAFSVPTNTTSQQSQVKPPSPTVDLFSSDILQPAATTSRNTTNNSGFDAFSAPTTSNKPTASSVFDDFTNLSTSTPANKPKDVLSLFDSAPAPVPHTTHSGDPFGGLSGPGFPPPNLGPMGAAPRPFGPGGGNPFGSMMPPPGPGGLGGPPGGYPGPSGGYGQPSMVRPLGNQPAAKNDPFGSLNILPSTKK